MKFDELKEMALSLPLAPGVYIMRDNTDRVIYVGICKFTRILNILSKKVLLVVFYFLVS